MVEWILWALFSANGDGLQAEWEQEIEGYISMIERLLGRELEPGWDDTIRCMKVSLDPVIMLHRPLIWYAVRDKLGRFSSPFAHDAIESDRCTYRYYYLDILTYERIRTLLCR